MARNLLGEDLGPRNCKDLESLERQLDTSLKHIISARLMLDTLTDLQNKVTTIYTYIRIHFIDIALLIYSCSCSYILQEHALNEANRTLKQRDTDPSEHSYHSDDTAESPARSVTPIREPPPRSVYGTRVWVTARKSVPIPIQRTFSIPHRDYAGPSRTRDRSVTPSPPEDRTSVTRPTGMTPTESYVFSGMTHDVLIHQMKLESHDHLIKGLTNMMTTHHETMNKTIELLAYTMELIPLPVNFKKAERWSPI
ncbi:Transcription factor, K-box [Cynara cardunculus var. scolymus]|uniref:Transcription factor, K-box n=1 Tax=Cynara cardunculus var. scolymus TaxID=59895 RepID=A0A103STS9_CYNCS|nr:Transcription factor, K-box [Cynara cardunculus var. scolymus]